jgi:hypothetical protein
LGVLESDYNYLGVRTAVNWLDYTLNGDQDAKAFFVGTDCGLCDLDQWSVKTKGLP